MIRKQIFSHGFQEYTVRQLIDALLAVSDKSIKVQFVDEYHIKHNQLFIDIASDGKVNNLEVTIL